MAGCFGNDPYDRYVERQLFKYLEEQSEGEEMENLVEDMMNQAVTDAKLFRTYDDDYEVIDRDQVMRCLANLDDAIKSFNHIFNFAFLHSYENDEQKLFGSRFRIDAIFTALSIMQKNLQKAVEHEAEEALKSKREMDAIGGKK